MLETRRIEQRNAGKITVRIRGSATRPPHCHSVHYAGKRFSAVLQLHIAFRIVSIRTTRANASRVKGAPAVAKTALCVGINDYEGVRNDLHGCVNDAADWKKALEARGYSVTSLLDKKATKAAMVAALTSLVSDAASGDSIVFTYSGHGSFVPDLDRDEPDGVDEVLCPWDIEQQHFITDDELYDIFAQRERGVAITFIADSCFSGDVARLGPAIGDGPTRLARFLPPARFLSDEDVEKAKRAGPARSRRRPSLALLLAGCQDTQVSYDASFGNRANGAFTYVALAALENLPARASYSDWHHAIREALPSRDYPQDPAIVGTKAQRAKPVLG
jgi:hypothetical protein